MAVTKHFLRLTLWLFCFYVPVAMAGILPEDRADALYHSYEGGGVKVDGPSILIRKSIGDSVSVFGNHYVDNVSSASIDVITQGSPYEEERTENSIGVDYLHGKATMSLSYTNSEESDYTAETMSFGISQDMFGDLTTVSLGYSRGDNIVRRNVGGVPDPTFEEEAQRQSYRVSLSQILTKNLVLGLAYEGIADEGFLNNPYRSVRYGTVGDPVQNFTPEIYPKTRTSNAGAIRARYFLPYRAAVFAGYRIFADSWGIDSSDIEVGYVHPLHDNWIFELKYRSYSQTAASFYSDLFSSPNAQNFLARDKELSTFDSQSIGLEVSYEFAKNGWGFIDKGSANFALEHLFFDYRDFRENTDENVASYGLGNEPLYSFEADVIRAFVSIWY